MPKIIGVRFRNVGKVYYFDPGEYIIHYHDHVIVETARGLEYGTVVITPTELPEEKITSPLKPVLRMADKEDDEREKENREREREAYRICKQRIAERGLDMKLIEAEYTFDNSKVLFYFTADGRIDFRELVKDLAGIFRTRIELRQIGVRDETKLLGGIGSCGRPLCCHTWLNEFVPVSIKMAKDQNLSLNPSKISGSCGRLMCCLKNEADTYAYLNRGMPGRGDLVTTPDGLEGDVVSVNVLRQTVKVIVDIGNDEKEMQEFEVKDITFIPKAKRPKKDGSGPQKGKGEKSAKQEKGRKEKESSRRAEEGGEAEERTRREESGKPKREEGQRARHEGGKRAKGEEPERNEERVRHEGSARPRREETVRQTVLPEGADTREAEEGAREGSEAEKKKRRRRRTRHRGPRTEGEQGGADSFGGTAESGGAHHARGPASAGGPAAGGAPHAGGSAPSGGAPAARSAAPGPAEGD